MGGAGEGRGDTGGARRGETQAERGEGRHRRSEERGSRHKYSDMSLAKTVYRQLKDLPEWITGSIPDPANCQIVHLRVEVAWFLQNCPTFVDACYTRGFEKILFETELTNFPVKPPRVRLIEPRIEFQTGHITINGRVCHSILAQDWDSSITLAGLFQQIATDMSEGGIRLAAQQTEYDAKKAEEDWERLIAKHGWTNPHAAAGGAAAGGAGKRKASPSTLPAKKPRSIFPVFRAGPRDVLLLPVDMSMTVLRFVQISGLGSVTANAEQSDISIEEIASGWTGVMPEFIGLQIHSMTSRVRLCWVIGNEYHVHECGAFPIDDDMKEYTNAVRAGITHGRMKFRSHVDDTVNALCSLLDASKKDAEFIIQRGQWMLSRFK